MYTIKHAARLTGLSEATLRAWERRYQLVTPERNAAGYRVYDKDAIAAVLTARRLVDAGWAPAEAARAVRDGGVPTSAGPLSDASLPVSERPLNARPSAMDATDIFLRAAAAMDPVGVERGLDSGFALGSFEHAVESWLLPTLVALGEGWASGRIDVAGEHLASQAVHRRLSAAFDAAGSRSRGPKVVVGLPTGSLHELGALAFATAARRRGLNVLYVGSDVPVSSWVTAVEASDADAAVMAVVTPADREPAAEISRHLATARPGRVLVATGGANGSDVDPGVTTLPGSISAAVDELDAALHLDAPDRSQSA